MGSKGRRRKAVTAAGVVLLGGDPEHVLLIRDPDRPDSWSLPTVPVGPGEYLPGCAVRAIPAEAKVRVRLGPPMGRADEDGDGRPVAWWRAHTSGALPLPHGDGGLAWVPAVDAVDGVPAGQQNVVRQGLDQPGTLPLLIVRHTKAMSRSNWSGRDQARPLDARGRRQAGALVPLLDAYGVARLASSTSTRCVKTLLPYAKAAQLEIEGWSTLSEEQAEGNLKAVDKLMKRLIRQAVESGLPLAICGHRPVLPTMLAALGVTNMALKPGACVVAHLTPAGSPLAVEHHPPRI